MKSININTALSITFHIDQGKYFLNSFLSKCQNRIYNTKNNKMQAIIKIVNLNGGGTLVMYVYVGQQYQNGYYKALG